MVTDALAADAMVRRATVEALAEVVLAAALEAAIEVLDATFKAATERAVVWATVLVVELAHGWMQRCWWWPRSTWRLRQTLWRWRHVVLAALVGGCGSGRSGCCGGGSGCARRCSA